MLMVGVVVLITGHGVVLSLLCVACAAVGRGGIGRDYSGGDQASPIGRRRVRTVPAAYSAHPPL